MTQAEFNFDNQDKIAGQIPPKKTQKTIIKEALINPMTINELYVALPDIDSRTIAPLVTNLIKEDLVYVVGQKKSPMACGVAKIQNIYSSRVEDKPKSYQEGIALLQAFCGLSANATPPHSPINARVHVCKDD